MRSLRKKLRTAVLSVPLMLAAGCGQNATTSGSGSTGGSTGSTSGSTGGTTGSVDSGSAWTDCDPQTEWFVDGVGCQSIGGNPCISQGNRDVSLDAGIIGPRGAIDPQVCDEICASTIGLQLPILQCHAQLFSDGGPFTVDGGIDVVSCVLGGGCNGRQPEGLKLGSVEPGLGGYFAQLAALEAASVPAFRRLARDLEALGAPTELIQRAREAARDEIRHARQMRQLANRFGGAPVPFTLAADRPRTRFELAMENAVEGCVRETLGAALAMFQAEHAVDAEIREVMSAIADDESAHAELAWALDAWLVRGLTSSERSEVRNARTRAIAELEWPVIGASSQAGLPAETTGRALVDALRREVWASAHGSTGRETALSNRSMSAK